MCAVYNLSSSVKVEQLEDELSLQFSDLRTEIEENRPLTSNYSSVSLPKDVSFYRGQRDEVLRGGLQVANAVPLQSQSEVMGKELESCLNLEYTTEHLSSLLHQFFVDRSYHLAQIKYILMLRWRRFCRHAEVIEKLYPRYKDQMKHLTTECEDAVQRARRLVAYTVQQNPVNFLTPDDVVIYLRWLISHLHSVRTIHNFIKVLHSTTVCQRPETEAKKTFVKADTLRCSDEPVDIPHLPGSFEAFSPELQSLIHCFHLSYDAYKIKATADEMELFSMVWREFKTKFIKQEEMRTFLQFGGTKAKETQWGRKSSTALKKEANWMHYVQVKPRRDPWQQKLVTKLKESQRVDELLKMHDKFLQVSDVLLVASALKDQANQVNELKSSPAFQMLNKKQTKKFMEIWTSIYNCNFCETTQSVCSAQSKNRARPEKRSQTSSVTSESVKFLSEDSDEENSQPFVTGGAYLSLIYLRHLKLRELQRTCLGLLNYLRSVERTLAFDLAGLKMADSVLVRSGEESGLLNAARGGRGETGRGLDSQIHCYNSPVDYKVHCSEFMQFTEVDNLHDFYSFDDGLVHVQDRTGLYVMYDAALKDLLQLREELLLVGSHFIQKYWVKMTRRSPETDTGPRGGAEVDRAAVLLQLWTLETEYLESKVQLFNCYYEAYQHTAGTEQRFAVGQVLTDLIHTRPQFDLNQDYFTEIYQTEINSLQIHQQLITGVLNKQIDKQREYLQRMWRHDHRGASSVHVYGLPPNYTPKHLVTLGGSRPVLKSVFLTEVHPSLCLSAEVYNTLVQVHRELCQLHRATTVKDKLILRQRLLQDALDQWDVLCSPEASYSPQTQKDLFSGVFFDDPMLVERVGQALIQSAEEKYLIQGKEKQEFSLDTFTKLLELVTIRHRLVESASETALLAQLYRNMASELGFGEFHLYLRPVHFEVTEQKRRVEQKPVFITDILEDDSLVDRFVPSHLPLSIQELDENHIGRFSFSSQEAVIHLMNSQSIENLFAALKLTCFCHWTQSGASLKTEVDQKSDEDVKPATDNDYSPATSAKQRLQESFLSIQLEKVGLRDEMLNSFMKKKQATGGLLKTQEDAARIKRGFIIDFLKKFTAQISQHCVRAQIIGHYYSLRCILIDYPSIRQSHFRAGREKSGSRKILNSQADLCNHTSSQSQLMSSDGRTLLNLWHIPDFTEVLHNFKSVDAVTSGTALHHMLQIASGLHDIIYYLVSFSRLGNTEDTIKGTSKVTVADWGGVEGIDSELQDVRHQLGLLARPCSPEQAGCLLQLRRQVLILQFDTAVRHLIREAFLSSGDISSYQAVSDNMAAALPLLSDCVHRDAFSVSLPLPPDTQRQKILPWRSFFVHYGVFPLRVWDVPPIEYCMQLCLSGLSSRSRLQANAAMLGVTLLMEDVLNRGGAAVPLRLHGNKDDPLLSEMDREGKELNSSTDLNDPTRVQSALSGFLLLNKQLQFFKEAWARRRLGIETFTSINDYKQFVKLYRAEIYYPSMRDLAQHLGQEQDNEVLVLERSLLPPAGAAEGQVKTWQLLKLLESIECDMIRSLQRKLSKDMTLVVSERTRQDGRLPTELWRKTPLKYSLSQERPQLVETFIQHLMEEADEKEGQVTFPKAYLNQCLIELGCLVMERERHSFQLNSQFYEQILQQMTQSLHQKEQDIKNLTDAHPSNAPKEVADYCRELMLGNSALNAQVAFLEEEKSNLEKQLSLKFKEQYDALVRQLISNCVQLQAALDEQRSQMQWDVIEMVSHVRSEAVDKMMKTRKKYGSCKNNEKALGPEQSQSDDVNELKQENSRLMALLRKRSALSGWRQVVDQSNLHKQLLQTQQREISSRCEALRVTMMSEEEVVLLRQELDVLRRELEQCQDEYSKTKRLLSRKSSELSASREQSLQEAHSRQQLDLFTTQTLDQIRATVKDRDERLQVLSEELDRDSKMHRLERQRSAKEIRQVKGQLLQERSLKHEAFHRVEHLQSRVSDMEAALSRHSSTAGRTSLSLSKLSPRNASAGVHRQSPPSCLQRIQSVTHFCRFTNTESNPRRETAAADRHLGLSAVGSSKV